MIPSARPEDELLIYVARRSLDGDVTKRIESLLRGDLDWTYLLTTAQQHAVIPLLHQKLSSVATTATPRQVMAELRDANQKNAKQSLFLTGELVKLVDLFEAHGVQAIPFKGPTLALCAYRDVGLRQFGDLDLLIHRQDATGIRELLINRGFRPEPQLTANQQAALLRFDCAYNFINDENVLLDLHWNFVPRYFSLKLDTDRFWDRLESIKIGRRKITTLSPEDLLLALCIHGFTHSWGRLGWICDLTALIEGRPAIEWSSLLETTARLGIRRIFSVGLLLASQVSAAAIPEHVLKIVNSDHKAVDLAGRFQRELFMQNDTSAAIFGNALLHIRMRERLRDRIVACFRLGMTPRAFDWMFVSLPDWLFWLYYLLRPVRLAGKYGASLLLGRRTDKGTVDSVSNGLGRANEIPKTEATTSI